MRVLWATSGVLATGAGMAGVVLPLVPTVPFLLLAAYCFARGSDRLHDWLVNHPQFGHPIQHWREHGAISKRGKMLATVTIGVTFSISIILGVSATILAVQAIVLGGVLCFLWSRPTA